MGGWQHKHAATWQEWDEASDGNVHRPAMEAEAQGKGKGKRISHTVAAPHKGHGGKAGTEEYAHVFWQSQHQNQPRWQDWMPQWGGESACVYCGALSAPWPYNQLY